MSASVSRWIPRLSQAVILVVVAVFVWLVWSTYSNVYNSDAFAIPQRMQFYHSGEIGIVQLVLGKHVEHFHSLIFLFSFLDWELLDGTMLLPRIMGTIAALLYAWILICVVRTDSRLSHALQWTLAASVVAIALSANGWAIWTISFQSVVSTFWILYVGGIYAACRSAASSADDRRWIAVSFVLSAIALFAHGSGFLAILVPPVPLLLAGRWKKALTYGAGLALIYAIGSAIASLYPVGQMLPLSTVALSLVTNAPHFVWTILLYLGSSLVYEPGRATVFGAVCAIWTGVVFAFIGRALRRGERLSLVDDVSLCLILSGGLSAGLATALRFSLAVEGGLPFNPYAYMESRYFQASSAVWIGLLLWTTPRVRHSLAILVAPVLGAAFFASGLATGLPATRLHIAYLEMAEISVRSRHYEIGLVEWLFPDPPSAVGWLEFAASRGKGPFSTTATVGTSTQSVPIVERIPVQLIHADGSRTQGCRLSGPSAEPDRAVRLADPTGNIVALGLPSRYETNVTEQSFDEEDYLARNPDVAAFVRAGHIEAWSHRLLAQEAGERRLARSTEPGWLAFTATCDVTALR